MTDPRFHQSVTYICDHGDDGTMGLIINHPMELSLPDMFKQLNLSCDIQLPQHAVLRGGPVKPQRGFLLHRTHDMTWHTSMQVTEEVALTASKDVLESIAQGKGPTDFLFALGFAGWSPGQLEDELKENCWLTLDADLDILFNTPMENRWQSLYAKLGLEPYRLAPGGHA
jgi:putative transcriptional regulator